MVNAERRGADVRWVYSPAMDTYHLMGPWRAPDGRLDPREDRQYAHIVVAPGMVHYACINPNEPPAKFYNLDEAKAYLVAMVRLT